MFGTQAKDCASHIDYGRQADSSKHTEIGPKIPRELGFQTKMVMAANFTQADNIDPFNWTSVRVTKEVHKICYLFHVSARRRNLQIRRGCQTMVKTPLRKSL